MKATVYDIVTKRLVSQIEAAIVQRKAGKEWQMPFRSVAGEPMNATTRKPYRGVNWIMGSLAMWLDGRCGLFATYRQWEAAGAQVQKGEKGMPILFYAEREREDGTTYAMVRYSSVFAIEQTDADAASWLEPKFKGLDPSEAGQISELANLEAQYLRLHGIGRTFIPGQAYYRVSTDTVNVPPSSEFRHIESLASVVAHELIHSTGHEKRLDRFTLDRRKAECAFEELVAEIGAAMLCSQLGIKTEGRVDHAGYLASWLQALKDDSQMIVSAASKAQQAAEFILAARQPVEQAA